MVNAPTGSPTFYKIQLPDLDGEEFAAAVNSRIQGLELKDRVMVIAEELRRRLPDHYVTAGRRACRLAG